MFLSPFLDLLSQNGSYRLLLCASCVSLAGDWFSEVATVALLQETIGSSALAYSGLLLARLLPALIFAPIVGPVADKYPRLGVMVASDLLRAVCVLGFLLVEDESWLPFMYAVKFMLAALSAFFEPARNAFLPEVVTGVKDLVAANTLDGIAWSSMQFIGAALGGAVTAWLGIRANFVIDALSYVGSACMVYKVWKNTHDPTKGAYAIVRMASQRTEDADTADVQLEMAMRRRVSSSAVEGAGVGMGASACDTTATVAGTSYPTTPSRMVDDGGFTAAQYAHGGVLAHADSPSAKPRVLDVLSPASTAATAPAADHAHVSHSGVLKTMAMDDRRGSRSSQDEDDPNPVDRTSPRKVAGAHGKPHASVVGGSTDPEHGVGTVGEASATGAAGGVKSSLFVEFAESVKGGVHYLGAHPDLLWVTSFKALTNTTMIAIMVSQLQLLETRFSAIPVAVGMGVIAASEAVGNLLTPLVAMHYTKGSAPAMRQALSVAHALTVVAFLGISWSPSPLVLFVSSTVAGAGWSLMYVYTMALLQLGVESSHRGRVFAFSLAIRTAASGVGSLMTGGLIDGAGWSGSSMAGLCAFLSVCFLTAWVGGYMRKYNQPDTPRSSVPRVVAV